MSIRTGGKYNSDFNILDIYKFYKQSQKDKKKDIIDLSTFRSILKYHNDEICKSIVKESTEFRMPYRLGYLRIRKFKQRIISDADGKLKTDHMKIDWKSTNELWEKNEEAKRIKKLVFHTNNHSNGFYYKWYWDKRSCNIKNSSVYSLVISRQYKRLIPETIKNNDSIDYYE